jgi:hypothetical protein
MYGTDKQTNKHRSGMAEPRVVTFFNILSNEMIEIICFNFLLGIMHVFFGGYNRAFASHL